MRVPLLRAAFSHNQILTPSLKSQYTQEPCNYARHSWRRRSLSWFHTYGSTPLFRTCALDPGARARVGGARSTAETIIDVPEEDFEAADEEGVTGTDVDAIEEHISAVQGKSKRVAIIGVCSVCKSRVIPGPTRTWRRRDPALSALSALMHLAPPSLMRCRTTLPLSRLDPGPWDELAGVAMAMAG